MDRPRNARMLAMISSLMVGSFSITGSSQQNQLHGHRSSQGSSKQTKGLTGRLAKRAEKHRRRLTRRSSR